MNLIEGTLHEPAWGGGRRPTAMVTQAGDCGTFSKDASQEDMSSQFREPRHMVVTNSIGFGLVLGSWWPVVIPVGIFLQVTFHNPGFHLGLRNLVSFGPSRPYKDRRNL